MEFNIQPVLENKKTILYPLQETDFDTLYAASSDPEIWKQHPNKNRWKIEVFSVFFEGALKSKGAFKIVDKATGNVIGSTRIYNYDQQAGSVMIGYTFYATAYWGTGTNSSIKAMMLDYLFQFVSKVIFEIGAENLRSQIAIQRMGATKIDEQEVAYFGESPKLNFVYIITKDEWLKRQQNVAAY